MNDLEKAEKMLAESKEKQAALFDKIKNSYLADGVDEEDLDIEDGMAGDIALQWRELRDIDYMEDIIDHHRLLVRALGIIEPGDKKALHNGKKALETLVHEARRMKQDKLDDIRKAEEVIAVMDEIIKICDANRK